MCIGGKVSKDYFEQLKARVNELEKENKQLKEELVFEQRWRKSNGPKQLRPTCPGCGGLLELSSIKPPLYWCNICKGTITNDSVVLKMVEKCLVVHP